MNTATDTVTEATTDEPVELTAAKEASSLLATCWLGAQLTIDRGEEVGLQILGVDSERCLHLLTCHPRNEAEKLDFLEEVRGIFAELEVQWYVVTMGAWMARAPNGDDPFAALGVNSLNDPAAAQLRHEIVLLALVTERGALGWTCTVDTDPEATARLGRPVQMDPGAALGGRLLELLHDPHGT